MTEPHPALPRMQRMMLTELSKNKKQPALAEMARELLAGNLTPREVMSSSAYSDALMSAGKETIAKYAAMSDAEKEELAEQGRAALDRLAEEEAAEAEAARPTPVRRPTPMRRPAPEEDEETGSIMVRPQRTSTAGPQAPPAVAPRSVRDRRR